MEKRIQSKRIYDGKIIKVDVDDVELINQKQTKREVVIHNGGVGILAIVDGKIILVKQYRYPHHDFLVEIPAGKIEIGEDPYDTGMREIEEETGYHAKSMNLITKMIPTPGYSSEVIHIYEAVDVQIAITPLESDDDEFIDLIYLPIEEAYKQVQEMKICDAKTIVAIYYAYNKYIKKD